MSDLKPTDQERVDRFLVKSLKQRGYCMSDVRNSEALPDDMVRRHYGHTYQKGDGVALIAMKERCQNDACKMAVIDFANFYLLCLDFDEAAQDALVAIDGVTLDQLASIEEKVIEYKYGVANVFSQDNSASQASQGSGQIKALDYRVDAYKRALRTLEE